jgi:hypothetical protein
MRILAGSVFVFLAACASVPDFIHERNQIMQDADVLCWVSSRPALQQKDPDGFQAVLNELGRRKAICTPDGNERGRLRIVSQANREKALGAQAHAQNTKTAEGVLRGAAFIGGLILLAPALAPPPPKPVTCQWQMSANGTGSAICR